MIRRWGHKAKSRAMAAEKDESSGSESASSEEEEVETSATGTEIVNVDFEARSPEESDSTSIQRLLKQLIPFGVDHAGLTQLVLSQSYVGAVVVQPNDDKPAESEALDDDEEDIFGLTTLINLHARKDNPSVVSLINYLRSKYEAKESSVESKAKFSDLFEGKLGDVGWIINERFVNLPSQLAPNLFESLSVDLEEAVAKSMPYKISKYLVIAKAHVLKGGTIQNPLFVNDEEELFFEDAMASFSFFCTDQPDDSGASAGSNTKKGPLPLRVVMLLDAETVKSHIQAFKKLFE